MNIIDKIKDIIFRIKDYDRLEHDYCCCLCYFTNNRLSKPNYKIEAVMEVILESLGEYKEEGYNEATREIIEWLKENINKYLYNTGNDGECIPTCSTKMYDDLKNYMKGE